MHHLTCLLTYALFLSALAMPREGYAQGKTGKDPSIEACGHVVSYANRGQLAQLLKFKSLNSHGSREP
jgi:hypothetical protein